MNKHSESANRYNRDNTVQYCFRFNKRTDEDIIRYLDNVPNKLKFIKNLIRDHINA